LLPRPPPHTCEQALNEHFEIATAELIKNVYSSEAIMVHVVVCDWAAAFGSDAAYNASASVAASGASNITAVMELPGLPHHHTGSLVYLATLRQWYTRFEDLVRASVEPQSRVMRTFDFGLCKATCEFQASSLKVRRALTLRPQFAFPAFRSFSSGDDVSWVSALERVVGMHEWYTSDRSAYSIRVQELAAPDFTGVINIFR
jgi:hypothetical protein